MPLASACHCIAPTPPSATLAPRWGTLPISNHYAIAEGFLDGDAAVPAPNFEPVCEDPAAWFNREILPHVPALRRFIQVQYSTLEVEDVVQDAFVRVMNALRDRSVRSPRSFLFLAARCVALDMIRHRRVSPFVDISFEHACSIAEERDPVAIAADRRHALDLVREAIATFPARMRESMALRRLHGISVNEIAMRLGVSCKTIHAYVAKGDRRCAAYLAERGFSPLMFASRPCAPARQRTTTDPA